MRSLNLDSRRAEILAMRDEGMIIKHIAADLKVGASTLKDALKRWARHGDLGFKPVLPGFEIARTSVQLDAAGEVSKTYVTQRPERGEAEAIPEGHVVKGVSILQDGDGRTIQKWVKTKEGIDTTDIIATLKTAFADIVPFAPPSKTKPRLAFENTVTLLPLPDLHIGMFSWGQETGRNWDTKIAETKIGSAMERLIARTVPSKTAIVLGGGDALHSDSSDNRTKRSNNVLDVDGRRPKVLKATLRLFVRIIDLALARHEKVIVRVLPGNHDEDTAFGLAQSIGAWYRNEPRVTVDEDPGHFWWFRFGKTFLGATHGHAAKGKNMPAVMATRRAQDWGASEHRVIHMFHIHHATKILNEDGGAMVETHQAPCPQDAWHYNEGFLSGTSLSAIVYAAELGEVARSRVLVR